MRHVRRDYAERVVASFSKTEYDHNITADIDPFLLRVYCIVTFQRITASTEIQLVRKTMSATCSVSLFFLSDE